MTLMHRRRALMMAGEEKESIHLVDGVYQNSTTVTNGNHIDMNPLRFNGYTTIPLTKPIEVNQSVGIMRDGKYYQQTIAVYAVVNNARVRLNSANYFNANTWHSHEASGTLTAISFLGTANGFTLEANYSLKVDDEVIF